MEWNGFSFFFVDSGRAHKNKEMVDPLIFLEWNEIDRPIFFLLFHCLLLLHESNVER